LFVYDSPFAVSGIVVSDAVIRHRFYMITDDDKEK
jgi:hypothetical protein